MQLSLRPSGIFHVSNPTNTNEISFANQIASHGISSGLLFLDSHPNLCESLPELNYWLDFTRLFLAEFSAITDLEIKIKSNSDRIALIKNAPLLAAEDQSRLMLTKPMFLGSEYLNESLINQIWTELHSILIAQIVESKLSVEEFFSSRHQGVSLQGRVWFHLAENKENEESPFAFLATYSNKISESGFMRKNTCFETDR